MRLLDGVQTYVDGKRIGGANYAKGIQSLSAFCRHAGNVELNRIRERQVASFLDGPHTSPVTWRNKYNLLKSFFLFWVARNAMLSGADAPSATTCSDNICSLHLLSD